MNEPDYDRIAEDPAAVLDANLDRMPDHDPDEMLAAAAMIVGKILVDAGLDPEEVADMFTERDHTFNFSRDEAGNVSVTVQWNDNQTEEIS